MDRYTFHALLSRMKYIARWGLMRASRSESLSEHTTETAVLAHALALIDNLYFNGENRPEKVAAAALYHDASEILTGDMPTPVKYKNEELKQAYKKTEADAARRLAQLLPPEMSGALAGYLTGECLTRQEAKLLKAADRLSALIKCMEEEQSGNREFRGAKAQQERALKEMKLPAADYFMKHMLPCYSMTLDELAGDNAAKEEL
ncbi:MAG: 5'-deoxynucleotidase [Oscillospiraceae bacterium]|nr:5'-deoxynucleotidase [Oscillospiraceae bacterium]